MQPIWQQQINITKATAGQFGLHRSLVNFEMPAHSGDSRANCSNRDFENLSDERFLSGSLKYASQTQLKI
jgi:hypothetical protein